MPDTEMSTPLSTAAQARLSEQSGLLLLGEFH